MNFKNFLLESLKDFKKGQKVYNAFVNQVGKIEKVNGTQGDIVVKFNGKLVEFSPEELESSQRREYDWEVK